MSDKSLDLENFPTSETAKKMLEYVSDGFYEKSYVAKWIYQVIGLEYDDAMKIIKSLPDQLFLETATWGLMYHELKWKLPVRNHLPDEERKKLIYQKRNFKGPVSPFFLEKHLKDATGFDVYICDAHDSGDFGWVPPHPNTFKVFFSIGDEDLNTQMVSKIIDLKKLSHTNYILCFRIVGKADNRKLSRTDVENVEFHILINFNGADKYRPGMKSKVKLLEKENIELSLITKKKDSWFLDGSFLLNGEKTLSSVYRKETIE